MQRYAQSFDSVSKVVFVRKKCVVFRPIYWFWKICFTPNDFFILKIIRRRKLHKSFYHPIKTLDVAFLSFFFFFSFFKDPFCCGMVKQRNFFHVVDLSFDARFVKYHPFRSFRSHHKQSPINNINVKCLQIGQNVSDIFWTSFLQKVSEKLRGFLVSSYWSCDLDFR